MSSSLKRPSRRETLSSDSAFAAPSLSPARTFPPPSLLRSGKLSPSPRAHHLHVHHLSPLPTYEDLLAIAHASDCSGKLSDCSSNNSNNSSIDNTNRSKQRGFSRSLQKGGSPGGDAIPCSKSSKSSTSDASTLKNAQFLRKRSRPPAGGHLPPLPPFIEPLDLHRKGGGGGQGRKPPLSPGKAGAGGGVSLPRRLSSSPPPSTPTSTLSCPPSCSAPPSHSRASSPSHDNRIACPPPPNKPVLSAPHPGSPMSPQSPASSLLGLAGSMGAHTGVGSRMVPFECKGPAYDEAARIWDMMFLEGWRADVCICCDDGHVIPAHAAVIGMSSPILKRKLEEARNDGRIFIYDQPFPAVRAFVRFLYSARYEEEDMQQYSLHLLVLAHAFNVPALKRVCTDEIAGPGGKLSVDTAIDMLQLAYRFDAPRLRLLCERFVVAHFKEIVHTDGWKVMMDTDPDMERHILEAVVEAEGKQEERRRKREEDALFRQLYDATQALSHICQDGCRSIRPHTCSQSLSESPSCRFVACQGVENLLRHFAACQSNVTGGCLHCKRMWQLLELHSRMCQEDEHTCRVILCRHFKQKRGDPDSIEETKWRMLIERMSRFHGSNPSLMPSPQRQNPSIISVGVCRPPLAFAASAQSRECACGGQ